MKNTKSVGSLILVVILLALFCGATAAWAQEVTGSITGTVTDPSGAPIAGASVSAKDTARGVVFAGTTNGDGVYYLERLPIGNYELKVEVKGFRPAKRPAFDLVLNQVARVDVQMVVGGVTETIEITGLPPLLQTDTTDVGTHIDHVVTENIPLLTRNYGQLTLLTPGAVSTNPAAFTSGQNTFQVGRPYINGNREQTNNYVLDGVDNNQHDNNELAYSPNPDAIEEFNLITQNPSAEFGNFLGGIVNVSIKSGTNAYHGSAFEFFRNDKLNANEWSNKIDPAGQVAKGKLRFNQFGGTFGGPIRKDRLFFFVDYQGLRNPSAGTQRIQVLSPPERQGNFGELCTAGFNGAGICSDATQQLFAPQAGVAPGARTAIPFNNLTAAGLTLSPAAKAIVNSALYPSPTLAGNQIQFTQVKNLNSDQADLKIDWTPTDKDQVFGRYSQQAVSNPTTETFVLSRDGFRNFQYPLRNGVIGWTHTISSTLANDLRLGLSYFPVSQSFSNPTGQNLPQMFGIPSGSSFLPNLGGLFGGVQDIGNQLAQANTFADTEIHAGDNVLLTHGKHEFRFGFQFNRYRDNFLYPGNEGLAGFFNFSGQYTSNGGAAAGSGLADFLLGLPAQFGIGQGVGNRHVQNSVYSAYGQDSWRVTSNITLNLGLRWEVNTPRAAVEGNAVNYALFGGQIITPTINNNGLGKALYNQYNGITNFQPRIGVAWQPGFLKNTVLRAAFGVSNFTESNGVNNLLTANPPFEQANNLTFASNTALPGSTLDQGFVGFPTGCTLALAQTFDPACFQGVNIHAFDVNLRPAVHYQWNLSIQKQLGSATTVQIGYVGQINQHLANIINLKQGKLNSDGTITPSPFLNPTLLGEVGQARYTLSNGISNYHALQAVLQQRFKYGLQAQVNYTFSKCLSDTPGFFGQFGDNVGPEGQTIAGWAFPEDPYNQKGDYGRCPQNIKHLFNGYVVYELPFGRGKQFGANASRALDAAIGGWRVSSSFVFHTGLAQTIVAPDTFSFAGSFFGRADCIPGVASRAPFTFDPVTRGVHFLNPAAVANHQPGKFGNCAVGVFDGPGLTTADLSIGKQFTITERHALEFRADMTNFTNTPIFGFGEEFSGQHTATASNYGEIFQSQGARQIQLVLKYRF
jgi:Carboxypeptidase regulatory-like domain/TonB dependent receptor